MLVAVVAATLLGFWQVEAWQAKRDSEARDLTQVDPVPLADVMGADDPFPGDRVGQPVSIGGAWIRGSRVLIQDRAHDGEDGYWLVEVLLLDDGAGIPVVLGWQDDTEQPTLPEQPTDLVGFLQPSEGTGATDDDPSDDMLPQLRTADLVQRVDVDLYGAYVIAEEGVGGLPPGDLEALPEAGRFTALRNLLYGIEWWVFGGFAIFLWWRWVRDETAADASEPADTVAA